MATKLELYNKALVTYLGTRRLASEVENVAGRFALDAVYNQALLYVLAEANWKFATRSTKLLADGSITPAWGLKYGFTLPDDYVRLAAISASPDFTDELDDYRHADHLIYSNSTSFYVEYVSKDPAYGLNIGAFPPAYAEAVGAWLAVACGLEVTKDRGTRADVEVLYKQRVARAKTQDAIEDRVKRAPPGRFLRARFGNWRRGPLTDWR